MNSFELPGIYAPVMLSQQEKDYIEQFVMGPQFPWYWQDYQTLDNLPDLGEGLKSYNSAYLSHILLARAEDPSLSHLERPANHFSRSYEFFIEIFHRFMSMNQLKYSKIYRANLNLTWHNPGAHSKPHKDHVFPHNNFIMYLNTCEDAETVVWTDDFSGMIEIPCQQYMAVTFKEMYHAPKFPPPGSKRVVFVVTYI